MYDLKQLGLPALETVNGVRWMCVYRVGPAATGGGTLYLAVPADAVFPAATSLILVPSPNPLPRTGS